MIFLHDPENLTAVQGRTCDIVVKIEDDYGDVYSFGTNPVAILGVKRNTEDESEIFSIGATPDASTGIVTFRLKPAYTADLTPGTYWYDVSLSENGKDRRVLDLIAETLKHGVTIGGYCSQWYANAALQELDHAIREQGHATHYTRYADNLTLFAPSKRKLRNLMHGIEIWLREHGMRLNSDKQIFPTSARMPNAMGFRYGREYTLPRKRTLLRFKRACRRVMKKGRATVKQARAILSRSGMLCHCCGQKIKQRWLYPIGVGYLKSVVRREQRRAANYIF